MVCIISIGKVDKYLITPIFGGIVSLSIVFIYNEKPLFIEFPFIFALITGISNCIAIIPLLISNFRARKLFKTKEYIEKVKKKRLKKFLLIFIATLISFPQSWLVCFYGFGIVFNYWIVDIILIYLFSYCILKARLHRHHYFSIIIIFISNICLYILYLYDSDFDYIYVLVNFVFEFLNSFMHVINKYNMEYLFCSLYELCFFSGLINIILYGISWLIDSLINSEDSVNYFKYFKQFDLKEFFLVIGLMVLNFTYNICISLTNKHYDPFYILILLITVEIGKNVIALSPYLYLLSIIYFMLLFAILVFNEVIELNCCGLERKTRRNMEKKASLELLIEDINNKERPSNCSDNKVEIDNYNVELEKVPTNKNEQEDE